MQADPSSAEGEPDSEPPAQGLMFLTTRAYLRRFGPRGRLRLVTRALSRGDVGGAWSRLRLRAQATGRRTR